MGVLKCIRNLKWDSIGADCKTPITETPWH